MLIIKILIKRNVYKLFITNPPGAKLNCEISVGLMNNAAFLYGPFVLSVLGLHQHVSDDTV